MRTLLALFLLSLSLVACKGGSTKEEKPKTDKAAPKKAATPKSPIAPKGEPKKKEKNTVSLKDIPVCDKYVKYACTCAKKFPKSWALTQACKSAQQSYPAWKRDFSKSKEQKDAIIKACQKGILILKSNNQCDAQP